MNRLLRVLLLPVLASATFAQPTINVEDLGGGSFDVNVSDLGPGSSFWTTSGLYGESFSTTIFSYPSDGDPNGPAIDQDVENGTGEMDVTFVSLPAAQSAIARFDGRSAPSLAGKYIGGVGRETIAPGEFDVAWFVQPGTNASAGYVARVVLDTSETGIDPVEVFATVGAAPGGTTTLASGVVTATTDAFTDAAAAEIGWTVYSLSPGTGPGGGKQVVYVDDDAPAGGDGLSWETAFRYLQDALTNSGAVYEVRVAGGTYRPDQSDSEPDGNGQRGSTFTVVSNQAIRGGYAGLADPNHPDRRDLSAYPTILSGTLAGGDPNAGGAWHVVTASDVNATAVLDGLIVRDGLANGTSGTSRGAGLYITNGDPTVINCVFEQNVSVGDGGAVYADGSSQPTFTGCIFRSNQAGRGAGLFLAGGGGGTLTNCLLVANYALDDAGAAYLGGTTLLTNCTISENEADDTAGGLLVAGTARVTNGNLWNNRRDQNGNGGGPFSDADAQILLSSGTATVHFSNVQGTWGGAGGANVAVNPLFVDADGADNVFGTADDDFRLSSSSFCIDRGKNDADGSTGATDPLPAIDLAGNLRRVDDPATNDCLGQSPGDCGTAPIVDIGAYEFGSIPLGPTIHVDVAATGLNNGSDWSNAFLHLNPALDAARISSNRINEILVAQGSYRPDGGASKSDGTLVLMGSGDRDAQFELINQVAIRGSFQTGGGTQDPGPFRTILDGDLAQDDDPNQFPNGPSQADNSSQILNGSYAARDAVLDSIRIENGNANTGILTAVACSATTPRQRSIAVRSNGTTLSPTVEHSMRSGAPCS